MFVSTTILIAAALIAVTIARRWQLCAVELRHRAAGLSNLTSESAEKDWFRTRARSETILITFCAIAIAATISMGLLAGGLVVLVYAVVGVLWPTAVRSIRRRLGGHRFIVQ
ncbi:hypothetical protein [Rhodococcus sp. BE178]|uniref:hypothetical protein n=1 Tax=Rhodococcus sp. BE178 TaxID=2817737 RepID=UPI003D1F78BE